MFLQTDADSGVTSRNDLSLLKYVLFYDIDMKFYQLLQFVIMEEPTL